LSGFAGAQSKGAEVGFFAGTGGEKRRLPVGDVEKNGLLGCLEGKKSHHWA